jgi:hypothetical protein
MSNISILNIILKQRMWIYDNGCDMASVRWLARPGKKKAVQSRTQILSCILANHGKYIRECFRKNSDVVFFMD